MNIAKYYWELNSKALRQTRDILKNPNHPQFNARAVTLLSRCDKPKDLFSVVSRDEFMEVWPKVSAYWKKIERESEFRNWWQTVYEQMLMSERAQEVKLKGGSPLFLVRFGEIVKVARIKQNLSQKALALKIGMKQPDISKIEEGKQNITLMTLHSLCKALGIKELKLEIGS